MGGQDQNLFYWQLKVGGKTSLFNKELAKKWVRPNAEEHADEQGKRMRFVISQAILRTEAVEGAERDRNIQAVRTALKKGHEKGGLWNVDIGRRRQYRVR